MAIAADHQQNLVLLVIHMHVYMCNKHDIKYCLPQLLSSGVILNKYFKVREGRRLLYYNIRGVS